MCNQSGGLIARVLEDAGLSTVVINNDRRYAERLRTARTVVVRFPFGRPFGREDEPDNQRVVLAHVLRLLATAEAPGAIDELPYRWRREEWPAILADLRQRWTAAK